MNYLIDSSLQLDWPLVGRRLSLVTYLVGGVLLVGVVLAEGLPRGNPPTKSGGSPNYVDPDAPDGPDWKKWLALVGAAVVVLVGWWILRESPPPPSGSVVPLSITTAAEVAPPVVPVVSSVVPLAAAAAALVTAEVVPPVVSSVVPLVAPSVVPNGSLLVSPLEYQNFLDDLPRLSQEKFKSWLPRHVLRGAKCYSLTLPEELELIWRAGVLRKETSAFMAHLGVFEPTLGLQRSEWEDYQKEQVFRSALSVVHRVAHGLVQERLHPHPGSLAGISPEGAKLVWGVYKEFCGLTPGERFAAVGNLRLSTVQLAQLDRLVELEKFNPRAFALLGDPKCEILWDSPSPTEMRRHALLRVRFLATHLPRDSSNG